MLKNGDCVLEIRSYELKSGMREAFHRLVVDQALPLLRQWKFDVVGYGPSMHDDGSYFLMRAFRDLEERDRIEDAFYGSPEWREGPRTAILAAIASYTTIVIPASEQTLAGLRGSE